VRVYADLLPASDGTAPFAIHTFNEIARGAIRPRQAAIANDHFVFTGDPDDERQTAIGRAFAQAEGLEAPYYATPGDGIFHFYFPEQGLILPGQFIPGADSHSRAYWRIRGGRRGHRFHRARLRLGDGLRVLHGAESASRRVHRCAAAVGHRQGHRARAAPALGNTQSQGMSVELVDADAQLPMSYRNTIANMMAEAEAANGIFATDRVTDAWYAAKGIALSRIRA
jgi:3-isopropylmalate/(R)-2-methylmalate dehydratase large subunit